MVKEIFCRNRCKVFNCFILLNDIYLTSMAVLFSVNIIRICFGFFVIQCTRHTNELFPPICYQNIFGDCDRFFVFFFFISNEYRCDSVSSFTKNLLCAALRMGFGFSFCLFYWLVRRIFCVSFVYAFVVCCLQFR